ncbi:MAG: YdjY domain-containing protein [Bacteroidetes bacterium]|nr:YdjY domain-containing protein [Bacteroidota bacterium]
MIFLFLFIILPVTSLIPLVSIAQNQAATTADDHCLLNLGLVTVDQCRYCFSFPAQVNMSRGLIEVVISTPGGKNHESIFITQINPVTFEAALTLIGCMKTTPYSTYSKNPSQVEKIRHKKSKPDLLEISVQYSDSLGQHEKRVETLIWDKYKNIPLEPVLWHFKGLPTDEKGNPYAGSGNNLVVSFIESDAILELNSSRLFNDNYFFVNDITEKLSPHQNVIIKIKRVN